MRLIEPKESGSDSESCQFFDTAHLQANLKHRSTSGGVWMILGQAASFFLRIGSLMVLARLLDPSDFGLYGMLMTLLAFVYFFKDAGLSLAVVQQKEIDHQKISTLFWINVSLGLILMVITVLLGPFAAWFYNEPILIKAVWLCSISLALSSLGFQHRALMLRQMHFARLAVCEVLALLCSISVAIYLAFAGFGYWALFSQPLTQQGTLSLMFWLNCQWRPGLPRRGTGVRSMLAFGGNLTGSNLVLYLVSQLDNILIGKFFGDVALGFYNRAYTLIRLPINQLNGPVTNVALPALSALQDEPEKFRNYYLRGLRLMASLTTPVIAWLFVSAPDIILIVLGKEWIEVILLFRLLAPAALVGCTNFAIAWVCIPLGQTDRLMRVNAFSGLFFCVAMMIGLAWGTPGVAASVSISFVLLRIPQVWYGFRKSPVALKDFLDSLAYPLIAASLACGLTFMLSLWLFEVDYARSINRLLFQTTIFYGLYLLGMLVHPQWRLETIRLIDTVKNLQMRKKHSDVDINETDAD